MTQVPSVSVIIPCYNVAWCVSIAIESVFVQGKEVAEIICVDDGSNDDTLRILEEKRVKSPYPFRIVKNYTNRGAAYSRNQGLRVAVAPYIQFLDADDLLLEGKISHQVSLLSSASSGYGFVAGDYFRINKEKQRREVRSLYDDQWLALLRSKLGITSSNLWNRNSLTRVGGFDEKLRSSQEYDLMFRLLRDGQNVIFDTSLLTKVNDRVTGSISTGNKKENWKRFVKLRVDVIDHLRVNVNIDPKRMQHYYQALFDSLRMLYPYDPATAIHVFEKEIPRGFKPKKSDATSGLYVFLYSLLGFRSLENIRHRFRR